MTTLPLFPQLYPNELFYSALARYKVRCGIISDKLLLHDVFGIKTVVASPEMPNCISIACENIQPSTTLMATDIIQNHTLYPLYTAFSEAATKQKVKRQMMGSGKNTYTTSTGLATCTLKPFIKFRYCPLCVYEQLQTYGEVFWDRRWFGFYTYCCSAHGVQFVQTNFAIHDAARHSYKPLLDVVYSIQKQEQKIIQAKQQEQLLAEASAILLTANREPSLSFANLTHFYRNLAFDNNLNRGSQIRQQEVATYIKEYWTWPWLKSRGFTIDLFEAKIASLFRKHRQQQPYPAHIIASLPFFAGNIEHWVHRLHNTFGEQSSTKIRSHNNLPANDSHEVKQNRDKWLALVKAYGTKKARKNTQDGGKLYAALYKADRKWLLKTNATYRVKHDMPNRRVNWINRDWISCKLLFESLYKANDIFSPRRSTRWFLCQLPNASTIEKNLHRLPKTALFLSIYSETFEDYQCRRLAQSAIHFANLNISAQQWQLYRNARINTQRPISSCVLTTCEWCINWLVKNIK